jgi:hypothetical protein
MCICHYLLEQKLFTLPGHLSSTSCFRCGSLGSIVNVLFVYLFILFSTIEFVFSRVRVPFFCVYCFVYHCLSLCPFCLSEMNFFFELRLLLLHRYRHTFFHSFIHLFIHSVKLPRNFILWLTFNSPSTEPYPVSSRAMNALISKYVF